MSIRNKLIIILLLFSIIPVITIGLVEIRKSREALKKQMGSSSLELARTSMKRINEYLYSKYVNIQGWTKNKCLNGITNGDKYGNIYQFLVGLAEIHDEYHYINCLNKEGLVIASSNTDLIGRDLSAYKGFKEALNGNKTMQDVAFNELAGEYAIVMSAPVRDIPSQSEVIGVLTVALKWDNVNEMITGLKVGGMEQSEANHIMLINKEGLVTSCFDPGEMFSDNLIKNGMKSAAYAQEHKEGYLTETSEHGLASFSTYTFSRKYKDLPHLHWNLILHQDPKAVFAIVGSLKKTMIITLSGAVGFLIIISLLFANKISKPILAIASAAKAIGKGDLNKRISIKSNDEIGLLSNSFNEMVKALRESRQMLNLVMDTIPQSIFWKDRKSVYLGCNRNFAKDAGVERPENIAGRTDYDLAWKKAEADFFRICDSRVMESNQPEYHIIEPQLQADGKEAWLDTNKVPLCGPEGNVIGILGTYEDITERKKSERHLNAQHIVTRILAESTTLKEASPKILQVICVALEWELGEVWIYDCQDNVLRCSEIWHVPTIEVSEFKKKTREISFAPGIGLPGSVWESGKPAWVIDVVHDSNFSRASIASRVGLHGAFGFPLISDEEALGTIEFFSQQPQEPDQDLLNMMSAIGRQIGLFIKRRHAEEKIKASLREKEKLIGEIYHRTKNNMAVICSLLSLQSELTRDEQVSRMFKEIDNRIKSMSLVHSKLYESKDLSNINLKSYIKDLAHNLFNAYQINPDKISLKLKAEDILITFDSAIPYGLAINEIITNSLKYAFPNNRKGEIRINLRAIADFACLPARQGLQNADLKPETRNPKSKMIELRIADNGIGMPEGFDLRKTNSFGLKIVVGLIEKQLSGKVELNLENGVEFLIKFKESNRPKRI